MQITQSDRNDAERVYHFMVENFIPQSNTAELTERLEEVFSEYVKNLEAALVAVACEHVLGYYPLTPEHREAMKREAFYRATLGIEHWYNNKLEQVHKHDNG